MALGLNESDIKRVIWTFVEAFVATFYALAVGLGHIPNFGEAKAALWAALLAAGAAALSALKNLVLGDDSTLK